MNRSHRTCEPNSDVEMTELVDGPLERGLDLLAAGHVTGAGHERHLSLESTSFHARSLDPAFLASRHSSQSGTTEMW
jgi:hypothetical protein